MFQLSKPKSADFSNLPLSNDFMFSEVMRQKDICKLFLEELLQKPIAQIKYITKQPDLSDSRSWHGVRLDVYIRDAENTRYDIEMQTTDSDNLERRIRYYQSAIDRQALSKGKKYKELPESFVIFVCDFDYFGAGLPIYERISCLRGREDIRYDDGTHAIILNSEYREPGDTPEAIIEFLHCIRTNDLAYSYQSKLMHAVCPAIREVRKDEVKEVFFLTYQAKLEESVAVASAKAHAKGHAEGHAKGFAEGEEEKLDNIIAFRLKQGDTAEEAARLLNVSMDDVKRAAKKHNIAIVKS